MTLTSSRGIIKIDQHLGSGAKQLLMLAPVFLTQYSLAWTPPVLTTCLTIGIATIEAAHP